ncbi:uracil-5--methyltransferase TRM9 [Viridothelium virens]|uniref:Uracil-5--methyltransferase TRM9 n=1 Tax=Viridothelium virens TaxID=1048519 RepID=A0A6A6HK20_VIRVR|nr:uracil-5--methyltransferase TRM9 [Viridothelium virens]
MPDTEQGYGAEYEHQHVHSVYERIAPHFSSTRYKPWPVVEKFLRELPDGSIGLDVGCGNGKYLAVNKNIFIVASDRSPNLVAIAGQHQPHSALVADALDLPYRLSFYDFAISVAVVHHLSTEERRVQSLKAIFDSLREADASSNGGRALIYVWALEQKESRRGWDEGHEQDVMVPWVMKDHKKKPKDADHVAEVPGAQTTHYRYYHLYRKGELEHDVSEAGGIVLDSGYEKDNWWAIVTRSATGGINHIDPPA